MGKKKSTRVSRHIMDPKAVETEIPIAQPPMNLAKTQRAIPALAFAHNEGQLGKGGLLEIIRERPETTFVLDTNLFIGPQPDGLWSSLLTSSKLAITPPVLAELESWARQPANNLEAWEVYQAFLQGKKSAFYRHRLLGCPKAADYYTQLLGTRRQMLQAFQMMLTEQMGREATRDELHSAIQKQLGERALFMALDKSGKPPTLADEAIVVFAVCHGIQTGNETILLTQDEHVQDQFHKLANLLDKHYRAMLFGDAFMATPEAFQQSALNDSEPYISERFEPGGIAVRSGTDDYREYVPECPLAPVACWLIRGTDVLQDVFGYSCDMTRLLRIKNDFDGRSASFPDGRNCHIHLKGYPQQAIIAHDKRPNGFPIADVLRAGFSKETYRRFLPHPIQPSDL